MKKWNILIIAALFIPMVLFSVWSLVDRDATVSESENRALKALPRFSFSEWISGKYTTEFEEYYNDTFPMRETFLGAGKTLTSFYYFAPFKGGEDEVTLIMEGPGGDQLTQGGEALDPNEGVEGKTLESPDVTTGPTDSPTSNEPPSENPPSENPPSEEPSAEPPELPSGEAALNVGIVLIANNHAVEVTTANHDVMKKYAGAVNNYAAAMPNSRIISMVVPNSAAFNAPESYRTGEHDQQMIINEMYSYLDEGIVSVDAYSVLRNHTNEYIYFRSDHHWSQLGAYYAYTAFCKTLLYDAVPLSDFETGTIEGFVGSLYTYTSKYPQSSVLKDNPDTVHWYRPQRDYSSVIYTDLTMDGSTAKVGYVVSSAVNASNKYLAFISGDNPLMVINTDVGNGKSVAIIKESYANAFVPFLVNHYEKIYVIDPRKYNGDGLPNGDLAAFVKEKGIDDVIVFDYPLVVSNSGYVNILNRMVGK